MSASDALPLAMTTQRRRSLCLRLAAVGAFTVGALIASAGALGAAAGPCGEFNFGFTGTRLINDGISTSAGPYPIELPAGTYDVTMISNDNHPTVDYQVDQTQEQWFFRLDNGYQSPPTLDIPSSGQRTITSFGSVAIDAAAAISVHHLEQGSVNSVNVECVGFTPAKTVPVEPEAPVEPDEPLPPPIVTEVTIPQVTVVPTTIEAGVSPSTSVVAAITVAPTTSAAAVVETTPVEVQAKVETPEVAELALTGWHSTPMLLAGAAFVLFGCACLWVDRRYYDRYC